MSVPDMAWGARREITPSAISVLGMAKRARRDIALSASSIQRHVHGHYKACRRWVSTGHGVAAARPVPDMVLNARKRSSSVIVGGSLAAPYAISVPDIAYHARSQIPCPYLRTAPLSQHRTWRITRVARYCLNTGHRVSRAQLGGYLDRKSLAPGWYLPLSSGTMCVIFMGYPNPRPILRQRRCDGKERRERSGRGREGQW
eukprot:2265015-Rhodomonas_salina.1